MTTATQAEVRLKNGTDEAATFVAVVMDALNQFMREGRAVVVYAVEGYRPFGVNGAALKEAELAKEVDGQWSVHGSVRNIVLSAVVNHPDGDMSIVNPIQGV